MNKTQFIILWSHNLNWIYTACIITLCQIFPDICLLVYIKNVKFNSEILLLIKMGGWRKSLYGALLANGIKEPQVPSL